MVALPMSAADAQSSPKMSPAETEEWLDGITFPALLDYLADANYAQHAPLEVVYPTAEYDLSDTGVLHVTYDGPITIRADNFLSFTVVLQPEEIEGFYAVPRFGFWDGVIGGMLVGIVCGGAIMALAF